MNAGDSDGKYQSTKPLEKIYNHRSATLLSQTESNNEKHS